MFHRIYRYAVKADSHPITNRKLPKHRRPPNVIRPGKRRLNYHLSASDRRFLLNLLNVNYDSRRAVTDTRGARFMFHCARRVNF